MPLPDKIFLQAFLALYTKKKEEDKKNENALIAGSKVALQYGQAIISSIKNRELTSPVPIELQHIVNYIDAQIQSANSDDDFYRLIFTLRDYAEKAQGLTTVKKDSDLSNILHGIANQCIENFSSGDFLKNKIESLKNSLFEVREKAKYQLFNSRGTGIEKINAQEEEILTELAKLGVSEYFNEARRITYFANMALPTPDDAIRYNSDAYKCSDEVNFGFPIVLQKKQTQWFYGAQLQVLTKISFEDFKKRNSTPNSHAASTLSNNNEQENKSDKKMQGENLFDLQNKSVPANDSSISVPVNQPSTGLHPENTISHNNQSFFYPKDDKDNEVKIEENKAESLKKKKK